MVYTYKRKTNRSAWSADHLSQALHATNKKKYSTRKAGKQFNISESVIRDYLSENIKKKNALGRCPFFSKEQEEEVAAYILS